MPRPVPSLPLLALFAALPCGGAVVACAPARQDPPAAGGLEIAAYAQGKRAPFDLGLRALVEAGDGELRSVAATFGLGLPETVEGIRWYRVLVVLEVGVDAAPLLDRQDLELRSRLGRVLSIRATREALEALGRETGVVGIHASQRVHALNEVGSSVSSGMKVAVPAAGFVDRPMPVEAGKTYTFDLGSKSPKATTADPVLKLCRDAACSGGSLLATDDDSGPGSDARIVYTATTSETLFVRASDDGNLAVSDSLTVLGSNALPMRLGTGARGLWGRGLRGQGAIVAVVDSGIDFCHDDFTTVDSAGVRHSRLISIWDENLVIQGADHRPYFSVPGGLASGGYGVDWTRSELDASLANCGAVRTVDDDGHGTHAMGTAAGNGRGGPDERYAGAAPDADILAVAATLDDTGIVDGVAYAVSIAQREHKPLSVNLSLGSHSGPHDGTSAISLALLAATGPGRAINVAAGNEADSPISASSGSTPTASADVSINVASGTRTPRDAAVFLWTDAADDWRLSVIDGGGTVIGSALTGQSKTLTYQGVTLRLIVDSAPFDTNPSVRQSAFAVTDWNIAAERLTLRLERLTGTGSGRWWGWAVPDSPSVITFLSHRSQATDRGYLGTINDMATSLAVLAVGASTSLVRVEKADGQSESDVPAWSSFGSISAFSSRGPARDGAAKPDVVAPGMFIVSTLSRSAASPNTIVETGKHQKMQGTSMATPAMTGVSAQLLAFDPSIIPGPLLTYSAHKDATVLAVDQGSSNTWGQGKADAVAAIARLEADAAPSVVFREAARDAQGKARLAVDVSDADGAQDLAYVLWDVDGDGANDAVTYGNSLVMNLMGAGPFVARATAVDKAGKTAQVTASLVVSAIVVVDAGVDAGRRDAGPPDASNDAAGDAAGDARAVADAGDAEGLDAGQTAPPPPVRLAEPLDGCSMHPISSRSPGRGDGWLFPAFILIARVLSRRVRP